MFIGHRQEQWLDWLGTAEFAYNNKMNTSTKVLLFRANSRRDLRMGFKLRKKEKHKRAEAFAKRIKEVQEKAQAVLRKSQEEIKKYADRRRRNRGVGD